MVVQHFLTVYKIMFAARRVLRFASKEILSAGKIYHGTRGVEVEAQGGEKLMLRSLQILKNVKDIPETSGYRQNVEDVYRYRLATCVKFDTIPEIEAAISLGQIEELLLHAGDELDLIEKYKEWRLWEVIDEYNTAPAGASSGLLL